MKVSLRSRIERERRAAFLVIATLTVVVAVWTERPATAVVPGLNGKIAFESFRDGNLEVYVMNADGSRQTNLTNNGAPNGDPDWGVDPSALAAKIKNIIAKFQEFDPPLPHGIAYSLVSKLENALDALERGNTTAARNKLEAFINEVEAQAGESITDEQAVELIAAAGEALTALE